MRTLGASRPLKRWTSIGLLALFLAGTNYCLLGVIPGFTCCTSASAAVPQTHATSHGCPACGESAAPQPASKSAAANPPCCLVYGPAPAPTVAAPDRLPSMLAMAVLVAPLALDVRTTAMARAQARRDDPPDQADATPRPSRAPPLL